MSSTAGMIAKALCPKCFCIGGRHIGTTMMRINGDFRPLLECMNPNCAHHWVWMKTAVDRPTQAECDPEHPRRN